MDMEVVFCEEAIEEDQPHSKTDLKRCARSPDFKEGFVGCCIGSKGNIEGFDCECLLHDCRFRG